MELKRIPTEAVPAAVDKALRYRLLNEPMLAESICLDVLAIDPDNSDASITLILSITDQFGSDFGDALLRAKDAIQRLKDDYEKEYYAGIVNERWGRAQLVKEIPAHVAFGWIREAMQCYERAETLAAPEEPDAALRWNTCLRLSERYNARNPEEAAVSHFHIEPGFADDVPHEDS